MADKRTRDMLLLHLQREQRHRLVNRMLLYLLFCAGIYLLLLFLLIYLDLPLLLFHFLLFSSLSLLPLFLILEPETDHSLEVVRRIDQHTQIEAFLSTTSLDHRLFLEPRVQSIMSSPEARLRLRVTTTNRFLAMGVLGLFLLLQIASLVTFERVSLTAKTVKDLRAQSESGLRRQAEDRQPSRWALGRELPEAAPPAEGASQRSSQRSEQAGESRAADRDAAAADQDFAGAGKVSPPGGGEEPAPWVPVPLQEGGLRSALRGALEQSPDSATRQGELPAGRGEAGEALLDSPLREYSASARREGIQTEGGTKLSAENSAGPLQESPPIQAFFRDFLSPAAGQIGFDPAIAGIRRRYLQALYERY